MAPAPITRQNRRVANSSILPKIRAGIGGWNFEPWRGSFYPAGLAHSRELEFASRQLDTIEINSTFHRSQKAAVFAKWREETPEGFVFSVKALQFATNRRVLAEGRQSLMSFLHGGVAELGPKLGPIVWRFAPTKVFERAEFAEFLETLPRDLDGLRLRHALDVRHESFRCTNYVELARSHGVATVYSDAGDSPKIADVTGDFVYARIVVADGRLARGFKAQVLDEVAAWARSWRDGGHPPALPLVDSRTSTSEPRDVFVYFINGAKEKAPAAALALRKRLER
jgi:uncharacterized protein YecE (DUF72 family)